MGLWNTKGPCGEAGLDEEGAASLLPSWQPEVQ